MGLYLNFITLDPISQSSGQKKIDLGGELLVLDVQVEVGRVELHLRVVLLGSDGLGLGGEILDEGQAIVEVPPSKDENNWPQFILSKP